MAILHRPLRAEVGWTGMCDTAHNYKEMLFFVETGVSSAQSCLYCTERSVERSFLFEMNTLLG